MDQGKKDVLTRHFSKEDLEAMDADELNELIRSAPPGAQFHAKAVVRKADGTIKYDDPSKAGSYGEL